MYKINLNVMKNFEIQFRKLFMVFCTIGMVVVFTSCNNDDDDPKPINETEVLVEYLESTGGTVINNFPIMGKATDVNSGILTGANNYVIDIRGAEAYKAGHVKGAVLVSPGDLLSHYEDNNLGQYDNVYLVCFSGQTAGWVNGLMHTMGYTNMKDLKWGMSSWNPETAGSWVNNIGNTYATSMVTTPAEKAPVGELPTIETGETVAQDILRKRVEAIFAEGFGEAKVTSSAVFGNPDNYYIVNYWKQEHYDWGHIPGAIQYSPKASLTSDTFLKTLPTDKPIVIYCYTGQTSAHVAAYLRVLGYDAKSLVFGVNGMAYDEMPGTKFVADTEVHDYELIVE
jgi:rhodanese-related sulfurtransferase